MNHIAPLITDLAIILTYAGIFTLIFKRLKQPLVLGYIVAGFLAAPNIAFLPSVTDIANVKTWADIGVIFLLFALGLEFSFKKIMKVGGTAIISTCTIVFCMMLCGIGVGLLCGWGRMNSIFLGGMIAMSSTTIIYKAFDDMGLRQQKFAGMVLSILILEDILAIVLMVMLSTMAVSSSFQGGELILSLAKLLFFLVLWFVVGIYLVPTFFKKTRAFMNDETLLLVALSFCFILVIIAAKVGFSAAFGAFIMGSILAETVEAEKIEHVVTPVKNLFGAIFFVSVGMMVDTSMIITYAIPIVAIILTVVIGQAFFGTVGVLLSGQPLKTAIQCGFSLTQIGEFSFIIATLGVSLGVTSSFLYPIVVAVSVITTFLTPYSIKLAAPFYGWLSRTLPASWLLLLDRYSAGSQAVNHESNWKKLLLGVIRMILIYSTVTVAIIAFCLQFLRPTLQATLQSVGAEWLGCGLTLLLTSPFLRAIVVKKNRSEEFKTLWNDRTMNHGLLVSLLVFKWLVALSFVSFVISAFFTLSIGFVLLLASLLILAMVYSRRLKKQSIIIERKFMRNFHQKERYANKLKPAYAGGLLSRDLHLAELLVPSDSSWAGRKLGDLNLGKSYGVHIVSIVRGNRRIDIPGGRVCLFPGDEIQVIGTDNSLDEFCHALSLSADISKIEGSLENTIVLRSIVIKEQSSLLGKSIRESGIREQHRCLVVGLERGDDSYASPSVNEAFQKGDVVWIVGKEEDVHLLMPKPMA